MFTSASIAYALCLVAAEILSGTFLNLIGHQYGSVVLLIGPFWALWVIVFLAFMMRSGFEHKLQKANAAPQAEIEYAQSERDDAHALDAKRSGITLQVMR